MIRIILVRETSGAYRHLQSIANGAQAPLTLDDGSIVIPSENPAEDMAVAEVEDDFAKFVGISEDDFEAIRSMMQEPDA